MLPFYKEIVKEFPPAVRRRMPKKVEIIAVSESRSRVLNRQYRKKNASTNVLSFRYSQEYGEIVVCPAVIRREAKKQKHKYRYQYVWMITHGLLHLAGMHHEKSRNTAVKFEAIEKKLLLRTKEKRGYRV